MIGLLRVGPSAASKSTDPTTNVDKSHISRRGQSTAAQLRRIIAWQWEVLPRAALTLLLAPGRPVDLRTLARFWSAPQQREYSHRFRRQDRESFGRLAASKICRHRRVGDGLRGRSPPW